MKGRQVLLLEAPDRPLMAARLDAGRLTELYVDPPADDALPQVEAIHLARVTRVAPKLGASFLDLGGGAEGFLKGPRRPEVGETLLVQVVRTAERAKAVPVSDEPLFRGRYAILTPHAQGVNVSRRIRDEAEVARLKAAAEGALAAAGLVGEDAPGAILRTAAEGVDDAAVTDDVAALAELLAEARRGPASPGLRVAAPDAETRAWRDWVDPEPGRVLRGDARLWDDLGVWEQVAELFRARVPLPGGAWMSVEPTAACVSVDVNTAADLSPAAALKTNLAALGELPRQLRLRGLGGAVVCDLAPASKRDRAKLEAALKAALRDDPIDTQVAGWSPLGHLELTRRRERRPLAELMAPPD